MNKLSFFEVTRNTDSTEGRGANVPTGIAFSTEDSAIKFCSSYRYKPFAVMGVVHSDGRYADTNVSKRTVDVYDSVSDFDDVKSKTKENIETALGKLSEYEQTLLGIDMDEMEKRLKKL